jgi:hypothetical protein
VKSVSYKFKNDKFILIIFVILLDLGCNAGGHLSCVDQAKYCIKDGSCGNKMFKLFNLFQSIYLSFNSFQFIDSNSEWRSISL